MWLGGLRIQSGRLGEAVAVLFVSDYADNCTVVRVGRWRGLAVMSFRSAKDVDKMASYDPS